LQQQLRLLPELKKAPGTVGGRYGCMYISLIEGLDLSR
jgi:hypothetical protein